MKGKEETVLMFISPHFTDLPLPHGLRQILLLPDSRDVGIGRKWDLESKAAIRDN